MSRQSLNTLYTGWRRVLIRYVDRVLVRISAELTTPRPERDCDGIFTVVVELNDMALPGYETGRCVLILMALTTKK